MTSRPVAHAGPELLATPEGLATAVADLGERISTRYPHGVVLVGVLKGSVIFLADLVRHLRVPAVVDFLAVTPYLAGSGRIRLVKDLDVDIGGRDVVLVEDIVDTGLTVSWLLAELGRRGPASLAVAAMVDKAVRRLVPVPVDFVAVSVPDVFVLGSGLDFAGRYRNVGGLFGADPVALAAAPDLHVADLYDR